MKDPTTVRKWIKTLELIEVFGKCFIAVVITYYLHMRGVGIWTIISVAGIMIIWILLSIMDMVKRKSKEQQIMLGVHK